MSINVRVEGMERLQEVLSTLSQYRAEAVMLKQATEILNRERTQRRQEEVHRSTQASCASVRACQRCREAIVSAIPANTRRTWSMAIVKRSADMCRLSASAW